MNDIPLPSFWVKAKFRAIAEIVGGGTPSRSNERYFDGDIPWVTPTDVTALDSLWIKETKENISLEGLRKSSANLLPAGTVLLTSRATIGKTAITRLEMCTNQGFVNFICDETLLSNEYLAYWLSAVQPWLYQLARGTTFKEISRSTLAKVQIPLPPISEQRRIVDILRRADDLRRLRREADARMAEFSAALFYARV